MKKALLFCLSLLLMAAAGLAAPANVTITSERGVPFNLRFDGRALTRGGARQVHLNRIAPGVHWAEFLIPVGYGRTISYRTRLFLDPGLETSYVLLTRPGRGPELRKVAAVPVRGGYGPGYGAGPRGGGYGYGGAQGGGRQGTEPDYDDDAYGSQQDPPGPSGGYGNGGEYGGYGNNGGSYPGSSVSYNRAMAPQDVDALVAAVRRQSFDKDKLPMARLAISETGLRAEDLARLMKELSFEDSRMELAKYGASRVVDRQNLYRLNEGFSYSRSAAELQEYLEQQPR